MVRSDRLSISRCLKVCTYQGTTAQQGVGNAANEQKLEAEILLARIGWTLLDFLKYVYKWGAWNDRDLEEPAVRALVHDFGTSGISYLLLQCALPVIVNVDDIDPSCIVDEKGINIEMPKIKFKVSPAPTIYPAGGHHRWEAWRRFRELMLKNKSDLENMISHLNDLDTLTEDQVSELRSAKEELEGNSVVLQSMKGWLGVLYDGAKLSEEAKRMLARNRYKTELVEQESEKMMNILRDITAECSVHGHIPEKVWESACQEAKGTSRISRVFSDKAFVTMLMQLRQWGTHFRQTDVFRASYLQNSVIGTHGGVSTHHLKYVHYSLRADPRPSRRPPPCGSA